MKDFHMKTLSRLSLAAFEGLQLALACLTQNT